MNLKPVIAEEGHNVVLKQVAELPEVNSSEGYVLTVTPDQVLIRATSGRIVLWSSDYAANG